jgi:hypothetical protein
LAAAIAPISAIALSAARKLPCLNFICPLTICDDAARWGPLAEK